MVEGDTIDEGRRASRASVRLLVATTGALGGALAGLVGIAVGQPIVGAIGGLALGSSLGLVASLSTGGWYLVLQRRLRREAAVCGLLPPDPVAFLEAAIDVAILRGVGGGVQFRHRTLAERLAEDAPVPSLMELRLRLGTDEPVERPEAPTSKDDDLDVLPVA